MDFYVQLSPDIQCTFFSLLTFAAQSHNNIAIEKLILFYLILTLRHLLTKKISKRSLTSTFFVQFYALSK